MDFGYYDASHFNKDFRRFTGESPVAFFRNRDALSTEIFRFCADVDLHRLDGNAAHSWSL
jgi:AraC-like DNA-binding protein